jgi:hypothetical protein
MTTEKALSSLKKSLIRAFWLSAAPIVALTSSGRANAEPPAPNDPFLLWLKGFISPSWMPAISACRE